MASSDSSTPATADLPLLPETKEDELIIQESNAPPKRGRGRPPKPKSDDPEAEKVEKPAATTSSRGRGRPPKNKDGIATTKPVTGSGRPRGRPSKKAKVDTDSGSDEAKGEEGETEVVAKVADGVKRGRGRPSKVKPAVAAAVGA